MSYFYTKEELDDIKALTDHLEENYEDIYEQSDLIESMLFVALEFILLFELLLSALFIIRSS